MRHLKTVFSALALGAALTLTPACASNARTPDAPAPLNGPAAAPAPSQSISVGGVPRWFKIVRPTTYQPGAPMVILLHGGTGNMNKALSRPNGLEWQALARRHGFLLLAPNGTHGRTGDPAGTRQHWNDHRQPSRDSGADDVAFLAALIDWAAATHQVDTARVYVTGSSNGGMMTYRALLEAPNLFAGGAANIANLPAATPPGALTSRPVPLLIMNGTADRLMKWSGGPVGARGQKDIVLSAPETRDWWAEHNLAVTSGPPRALPDRAPDDGCRLYQQDFTASLGGAPLRVIVMKDGGHAPATLIRPNRQAARAERLLGPFCHDASAAEEAWRFFTALER